MLTNKQCVRVATELWGLYLDDDGNYCKEGETYPEWSTYDVDYSGPRPLSEENISDEVNSWQGFGRTWDFFRDKYSHCITIDFCWHEDAESWACNVGIDTDYHFSGYGETQIEAIHLAALEAINDNQ